jgi:hypothetical protein
MWGGGLNNLWGALARYIHIIIIVIIIIIIIIIYLTAIGF